MSNTKYPLNGRYTSLGDIVQEFGKYSKWPTKIENNIDNDESLPNDEEQELPDNVKLNRLYWEGSNQPFVDLIYGGKSENAIIPYELVSFDDIYSRTKKDVNTKKFKLIQTGDSSYYSFGREIRAKEIANYKNNKNIGIPFRFIVANKDIYSQEAQDRYYFNYKTSDGEAVVIYALRNIIETCGDEAYRFLFGKTMDCSVEIMSEAENILDMIRLGYLNVINNFNNSYYITDNIRDSEITENFIFPSLFTADTSSNLTRTIYDIAAAYIKNEDNCTYSEHIRNNYGIFNANSDEQFDLSPDVYMVLGELVWSKKHIQYPNYTSNKLPILDNCPFDLNDKSDLILNIRYKSNEGDIINNKITINNELLEKSILYFFNNYNINNITDISAHKIKVISDFENYSTHYIHNLNKAYKLLYFCKLFLNSLRFYYSYITSLRFIRISSLTYALEQPVLRCDLGFYQNIELITIINAVHDYTTALPAGPLSMDTTIRINIEALVKYEGASNEIQETFPLILTFQTIKDWTDSGSYDVEQKSVLLITLNNELVSYDTPEFLSIKQDDTDDSTTNSDCSLGTLHWPLNINDLQVSDEEALEARRGNKKDFISDTADLATFNNDINYYMNEAVNNKITPFGKLKIQTVYSNDSEESIENSRYEIEVNILRHNNYYYALESTNAIENTELNLYYNPLSKNNNIINIPNTVIPVLKVINKNDIYKSNISTLNTYFKTLQNPYTIPKNYMDKNLYITIKKTNGIYYYYLSGGKYIKPNDENSVIEETYTTEFNLKIEGYINDENNWTTLIKDSNYNITKSFSDLNQYNIILKDSYILNHAEYLRISFNDLNIDEEILPIYYIKMYKISELTDIKITPLFTDNNNTVENNLTQNTNVQKLDFCISYLLYNNNNRELYNLIHDDLSFNAEPITYNINSDNLYFKLTSIYSKNLDKRVYNNQGKYYLYYNQALLHNFEEIDFNNTFNEQYININSVDIINLYISFNPIYVIKILTNTFLNNNNDIITFTQNIYDKDNNKLNNNNIATVDNKTIIKSFNLTQQKVCLNNDSFSIMSKNLSNYISTITSKFIKKLTYNINNNVDQYTFITNDMSENIDLSNLYILPSKYYNLKFTNCDLPESLDSNKKLVRIFSESTLEIYNNINITLNNTVITPNIFSNNDYTYLYIELSSGTNINITVNYSQNETYKFVGLYDSLSGTTTNNNNKTYNITSDLTIICKVEKL